MHGNVLINFSLYTYNYIAACMGGCMTAGQMMSI